MSLDGLLFSLYAFCLYHVFADQPHIGHLTGHHSKNLVPCSSSVNQLCADTARNLAAQAGAFTIHCPQTGALANAMAIIQ